MSDTSKIKQLEEDIKTLEVKLEILQKHFNEYVTNTSSLIMKLLNDVHNNNITKERVETILEEYIDNILVKEDVRS